ncbi:MAG: phosphotransferase family protein [Planctomycetota bacterium]
MYEAAGRAAAALGSLEACEVTLLDVLQPRARRYLALAADCFGPRAYTCLVNRVEDVACLRGQPAPPVHGDASPRNWRLAGVGGPAVSVGWIDWERSRPGCTMDDYIWLPYRFAVDRPDLLAAFLRGYGRPFTERERDQMAWLAAMSLAGAIPWALARGATDYLAELTAMAPRILDGIPWDE